MAGYCQQTQNTVRLTQFADVSVEYFNKTFVEWSERSPMRFSTKHIVFKDGGVEVLTMKR